MPRRAARVDGNQADIVAALRKLGVSVQHLHTVGDGCPDICCGWRGRNYLFEIKDPSQPPSKRKMTDAEEQWHLAWGGQAAVIETVGEAVEIMHSGAFK